MLCSQQKRSTFWTTSGCKCHKTLWLNIYVSGMTCLGSSTLKRATGYSRLCRKASSISMSFSRVFSVDFQFASFYCFLKFQVAVERCDSRFERFQVVRSLDLLDFGYVEQLPSEECYRVIPIPFPRGPVKLSLCLLQNKELLLLGSWVPNNTYSVVANAQLIKLARIDRE